MSRAFAFALLLALGACAGRLSQPQNFVVFFPTNDATLTPQAHTLVTQIASARHDMNPSRVVVEGRADGGTPHDAELADQRARAVIQALVEAGVDPAAIAKEQGAPPVGDTGVAAHQVVVRFLP
ncbi:MAG TPA: OmpA family protein [Stellaceae bacterium]|nr:OmpA family protein [Stellaceae bacterium]